MLALLSPKESKKKDHPLSPKSARAGARAAARAATPHTHCAALSKSLYFTRHRTLPHTGTRDRDRRWAHRAHTPRPRRAARRYIYREFCHPLLSRLARTLVPGWGMGKSFGSVLIFYTVSRMCETEREAVFCCSLVTLHAAAHGGAQRTPPTTHCPPSPSAKESGPVGGRVTRHASGTSLSLGTRPGVYGGASAWCWAAIRPSSAAGRARCAASAARGRCA